MGKIDRCDLPDPCSLSTAASKESPHELLAAGLAQTWSRHRSPVAKAFKPTVRVGVSGSHQSSFVLSSGQSTSAADKESVQGSISTAAADCAGATGSVKALVGMRDVMSYLPGSPPAGAQAEGVNNLEEQQLKFLQQLQEDFSTLRRLYAQEGETVRRLDKKERASQLDASSHVTAIKDVSVFNRLSGQQSTRNSVIPRAVSGGVGEG